MMGWVGSGGFRARIFGRVGFQKSDPCPTVANTCTSRREQWGGSTGQDVLEDDLDVVVAVRARVLVPEADHVTELVDDDAELVAVLADRDRLRSVAALSHERTAPASQVSKQYTASLYTCLPVYMLSPVRLSSVCNDRAPCSGGSNFR